MQSFQDSRSPVSSMPAAIAVMRVPAKPRTLLMVEDSALAAQAMRLVLRGTGARLRRADSLQAAHRHLALYMPDAVLVDIGLPDGSGLDLIAALARRGPAARPALLVATSGLPDIGPAAIAAGADDFLPKPLDGISQIRAVFAPLMTTPNVMTADPLGLRPDEIALRDDLRLASDLLCGAAEPDRRAHALQFISALGDITGDRPMLDAVDQARESGACGPLAVLLRHRLREMALI